MKFLKLTYLLIGLTLLGVILYQADLIALWHQVIQIGWGIIVILALYLLSFVSDSVSWQFTFRSVPLDLPWIYRLWKVRMVGEAFNNATPLASMGGEPLKVYLLKRHYGIGYTEGTASLILARTTNLLTLIIFLCVGFLLMLDSGALPDFYNYVAGIGLLAFSAVIVLFFLIQRHKIFSLAGSRIARMRIGQRLESILHHIHDMDDRLVGFYTQHRRRFAAAAGLALFNWLLGAVELYYTLYFLGHPVTLTEAWIIESIAQLVRGGTFFIPASLGAQKGAFLLVISAMTGQPVLGLAVAVIRRFREIVWIAWGLLLSWLFSFVPVVADEAVSRPLPPTS